MARSKSPRGDGNRRTNEALLTVLADLVEWGQLTDGPALRKALDAIASVAERRLKGMGSWGRSLVDGEEIALDVILDLHVAAAADRFHDCDAADLVPFVRGMVNAELLRARQKARALRRGGPGRIGGGEVPGGESSTDRRPPRERLELENVAEVLEDRRPSPEEIARAHEIEALFLSLYPDSCWLQIARGRIQRLTAEEIARQCGFSVSTVKRWLQAGLAEFKERYGATDHSGSLPGDRQDLP